jgi:hypothetical protein
MADLAYREVYTMNWIEARLCLVTTYQGQHPRDSPSLAHVPTGGPKVAQTLRSPGTLWFGRSLPPSS